jgi:hypothetical protein
LPWKISDSSTAMRWYCTPTSSIRTCIWWSRRREITANDSTWTKHCV